MDLIKGQTSDFQRIIDLRRSRDIVLEALNEYMEENKLTINDIIEITTLSINTIKKFLRGENIHQNSYYKLLRLGKDFENLIIEKCGGNVFSFV